MRYKKFLSDKRGESTGEYELPISNVIFYVLNILFFGILFGFVFIQSTGALIQEEGYAKQIALLLDSANPGMEFEVDFADAKRVAEDNKYQGGLIEINQDTNEIFIKLSSKSGYKTRYFTEYVLTYSLVDDKLKIVVGENAT